MKSKFIFNKVYYAWHYATQNKAFVFNIPLHIPYLYFVSFHLAYCAPVLYYKCYRLYWFVMVVHTSISFICACNAVILSLIYLTLYHSAVSSTSPFAFASSSSLMSFSYSSICPFKYFIKDCLRKDSKSFLVHIKRTLPSPKLLLSFCCFTVYCHSHSYSDWIIIHVC